MWLLTWLRGLVAPRAANPRPRKRLRACQVTRYRYPGGHTVERHTHCGPGFRNGDNPVPNGWTSRIEITHGVE